MSLVSFITNKRVKEMSILGLGVAGAVVAIFTSTPSSGAIFYDDKQMVTTTRTGVLGLELTSSNGINSNGVLNVDLANILPGESQTEQFTVKNTGTISGTVRITSNVVEVTGVSRDALHSMEYVIEGYGTLDTSTTPGVVMPLITLGGGESRTFTLRTSLASTAGNEWQGASVTNRMTVSMVQ